ncbi:hypothetical protein [Comamonas thiooxydans]|uniref:hypothetical protein n=1 Tax=Comamonas thiooxydans TaxID=363952 RepID=UPI001F166DF5|nr:hypothetical protein [Comamonas thiooxydans]
MGRRQQGCRNLCCLAGASLHQVLQSDFAGSDLLIHHLLDLHLLRALARVLLARGSVTHFGHLMLCHRCTRDAAPLLIYVDALFLGLINLGKIELDGMTKVIVLCRQGWWPDQGCRLLGMGLIFDSVQRYPAARCHLGANKDHQDCHPYGR